VPDRLRIACVGIWYPVAMFRYMVDALRRREDVEVWTAGPFTSRWIPWNGGMHLPASYVYTPNLPLPATVSGRPEVAYPYLEAKKPWEPDLWIEGNAGLAVAGRPIGRYAVIGTDPHVLDYSGARARADLFFNMQKPYMQANDIWLPYGYDPVWHSQTAKPVAEREWDASLIGLQYPNRMALNQRLTALGYRTNFQNGPSYQDARTIYHSTKVGVNWSSMQDTTARVFELMAFGIAPVLNRVPDLVEMFTEGQDFDGFATLDEAVEKCRALLDSPEKAQALGERARKAVEGRHSWDARMEQVLKVAGLLS
jgi:hypothetical protein